MTNYLETKIGTIVDNDFKILVSELCTSVCLAEDQFEDKTLANFFTAIVTEKKKMDLRLVLDDRILATKVKQLALGSVVHCICIELVNRNRENMDDYAGNTVFTLIKQCYKAVCPPLPKIKKPTRRERGYWLKTGLIKRGRQTRVW